MQGGTFTVSSLGGIGGTHFTPIINPPEVAFNRTGGLVAADAMNRTHHSGYLGGDRANEPWNIADDDGRISLKFLH